MFVQGYNRIIIIILYDAGRSSVIRILKKATGAKSRKEFNELNQEVRHHQSDWGKSQNFGCWENQSF